MKKPDQNKTVAVVKTKPAGHAAMCAKAVKVPKSIKVLAKRDRHFFKLILKALEAQRDERTNKR